MKRTIGLLVGTLLVGGSFATVASASPLEVSNNVVPVSHTLVVRGDNNLGNSTTVSELRAKLSEYGVTGAVQDRLIQKYLDGQIWDSLNGSTPVRTTTTIVDHKKQTIERFADGSFVVSTIDLPVKPGMYMDRSISSCSMISTNHWESKYQGCYANYEAGIIQLGFHFDWTSYNGGKGVITRYYAPEYRVVAGTAEDTRFDKFSDQRVRYSLTYKVARIAFERVQWIEAHVGVGSNVWTEHN